MMDDCCHTALIAIDGGVGIVNKSFFVYLKELRCTEAGRLFKGVLHPLVADQVEPEACPVATHRALVRLHPRVGQEVAAQHAPRTERP